MKKLLALSAILVFLTPMVAEAGMPRDLFGAEVLKAGFGQQGGKRKTNDDNRSNWSNDNGDSGNGRNERRDDRANQARQLAQGYRGVVEVQNVTPEGGPYFHARVRTADGRRLDLRINADTRDVREE